MIVGRNPETLDEPGVCRAAIESLAENFSDGVVAPVFWYALFGLPGIAVYKMVNTADSMVGHRTPRHEAYGWAAARLDDWIKVVYNLNPITPAVELMHGAFWSGVLKEPADSNYFTWYTLIAAVVSLAILVLGQSVFRRLEGRFAQDL